MYEQVNFLLEEAIDREILNCIIFFSYLAFDNGQ